ncbi:ABC transporter permease [Kitasatospora kifunensis]|uniref:Transport permease protein n=1 Tax=Kitasatospora kifunensis TaxID=58351 RepID=A0A7W7R458_KITKI|nr:ABC transporter permease [Kitasatospora kifunensis]MBB4924536.1 ABC-2 type transport system permease protein [Kitasatospora kifunensis]
MTLAQSFNVQRPSGRRLLALARTELLLLRRNRTALLTAVIMPIAMVSGLHSILKAQREHLAGVSMTAALLLNLTVVSLTFGVYYNLTAAYVARRGELVLKRLRTGELTDAEILGGTAVPSVLLALLQIVLMAVGIAVLLGLPAPVNPVLVLLGLLLAIGVLVPLAALTSAVTRTVETSGFTTLPVVLITMAGSGLLVPFSVFPGWLADLGRRLPATPALELLRIGWLGGDGSAPATSLAGTWQPALPYLVSALIWIAIACWAAHRRFLWEPRR